MNVCLITVNLVSVVTVVPRQNLNYYFFNYSLVLTNKKCQQSQHYLTKFIQY